MKKSGSTLVAKTMSIRAILVSVRGPSAPTAPEGFPRSKSSGAIVKMLRPLLLVWVLFLPFTANAQVRRQVPAPSQQTGGDFGSKFFDDLRSLFGRLQQSELDRAFQRAKPIHC